MIDKQEFLKKEIRKLRLNFKWQDVWMSYLEGIFSRGDRRLSGAIEKAFRLGCRFDGWSEHLNYDAWKEALALLMGIFTLPANGIAMKFFPGTISRVEWTGIFSGLNIKRALQRS